MDLYVILLRVIHIFSGVFWAGSTFYLRGLGEPITDSSGTADPTLIPRIRQHARMSERMGLAAALTVLSGVLLYWRDSGGLDPTWITTASGLALTIGGLAGIAAWVVAAVFIPREDRRTLALTEEIIDAGETPTREQLAELGALRARVARGTRTKLPLLVVAVLAMAMARYLRF